MEPSQICFINWSDLELKGLQRINIRFLSFFQIPSHGLLIQKYFLNSTTIRCEPSWKDYLPLNSGSEHSVLLYLNTCWS